MDQQTHLLILPLLEGFWADETIFSNCQVGFARRLQPSSAGVVPLGVEQMTAGGWCIVAPLGTTAAALALKDRFQETSQTFFSLLCCYRHLGQPRSHHISSKCESRPSSLWTPGATSTTLPSDQTRPSSGSSFFYHRVGASKASVKKKKVFSPFFCLYPLLTLCCRGGTMCRSLIQKVVMVIFQTIHAKILYKYFGVVILRSPTARSTKMWRWLLSDTLVCTLGEGALWQLPELGVFQHQGQATKYRTDLHFHN